MTRVLVEACVTSLEESLQAVRAGAGRLEVCSNLDVGGLTPSVELIRAVRAEVGVPIHAMLRLRDGSYVVGRNDVTEMAARMHDLLSAGADGVVLGVLDPSGHVEGAALSELVAAAGRLEVTFHRAFDEVSDLRAGLDTLRRAGVSRVLTSGGAATAWEGRDRLKELVEKAGDDVGILGGGRVRGENAVQLVRHTGLKEVHARASAVRDLVLALGSCGPSL